MELINRSAVIIKPKQPFLEWVNSDPALSPPVSMEYRRQDCTAICASSLLQLRRSFTPRRA
jgi:hypothetical protein